MEEVGELDDGHKLFVEVCEAVIDPKDFEYARWAGNGRPKASRLAMFKAYLLKMTLNLQGDKDLVDLLRQQPLSRRLCGWSSAGLVPSPSTFCRAFAEFAERGFTDRWFADFVREFHDAAYDAEPIRDESRELGHVPVIDANRRRSPEARRMTELEKEIYKDRSAAERVFSHLLDAHGGRNVKVRDPKKVQLHIMLGIIVIAVEQTMRMLC